MADATTAMTTVSRAAASSRRPSRIWPRSPPPHRPGARGADSRRTCDVKLGARFHQGVLDRYEEFVDILMAEGHPRQLAAWEVGGVLQGTSPKTLDWYFEQMSREYEHGQRRIRLVRKPDGVVCLNPPANASASNAGLGIASLMAGNTLVVKAPRTSPLGVYFLFRDIVAPALEAVGAPPGTLSIVCGNAQSVLRQWLDSPLVDDIMFFGDSEVGLQFGRDCVLRGKKPVLELAGNDCCVVWRDADLDRAVEAICESFYGSGQICMVPKWVLAHPAIADDLLGRLVAAARQIKPGYPEDPDVLLSPVVKADLFFDYLEEAKQAGEVLTGGRRVNVHGHPAADGLFIEPTIVRVDGLARAADLNCVREETFFPLLPVVVAEPDQDADLAEVIIGAVNDNQYGLRNSLWCGDEEVIEQFCAGVTNGGMLKVNDSHIGFVPVLATHGGTGRTGGPFGELNYPILRNVPPARYLHRRGGVAARGGVQHQRGRRRMFCGGRRWAVVSDPPNYFVTGATGLIGAWLVQYLLSRPGTVYALVRASSQPRLEELAGRLGANGRLVPVVGDLRSPRLGAGDLDVPIEHMFHVAAAYDLEVSPERAHEVNVLGTEHAVEFANAARVGMFHHTSSNGVAGRYKGVFTESMLDEGQLVDHPYFLSKMVAEKVVRARCAVPFRIYRPGITVGDSRTGRMTKVDGAYFFFDPISKLARWCPPWLPLAGPKGGLAHLVPVDYVASAMDHIAHLPCERLLGDTFHLLDPAPVAVGEAINEVARAAGAPTFRFLLDLKITRPVSRLARLLPGADQVSSAAVRSLGIPPAVMDWRDFDASFDTRNTNHALAGSGIACPPFSEYAKRLYDYWWDALRGDPVDAGLKAAVGGRRVLITGASSGIGKELALLVGSARRDRASAGQA